MTQDTAPLQDWQAALFGLGLTAATAGMTYYFFESIPLTAFLVVVGVVLVVPGSVIALSRGEYGHW